MDLWGAGINFILDGEKTKRKARKNFEIFGQTLKKLRDAKILE